MVIFAPKLQVAPVRKLLPVIVTARVLPGAAEFGETALMPGGGGGGACVTVKPLDNVKLCVSGLVTVTLRAPTVADRAIAMLAVSCEDELNAHELTVIPDPKLQVAPL